MKDIKKKKKDREYDNQAVQHGEIESRAHTQNGFEMYGDIVCCGFRQLPVLFGHRAL